MRAAYRAAPFYARPVTAAASVRVRFCPSPTGTPHVGLIRTALFNWAFARHTGGTFVFRIEDTDAARDSEESYAALLDALRWLGLDWDEGPEVGGPYAPYRQSERRDIYADVARPAGRRRATRTSATRTPEEVEARHRAAGPRPEAGLRQLRPRPHRRAEGRVPGRGPTAGAPAADARPRHHLRRPGPRRDHLRSEHVPDFVLVRANGEPLYTLVNPVDDALMGITHVLRGEDLLSVDAAPDRAVRRAGRRSASATARPVRPPAATSWARATRSSPSATRSRTCSSTATAGFLPEGLLNYLALLGWSIGRTDRDVFSIEEMVAAFDVDDVNPNPARFDLKKAEAINAAHLRLLAPDDLAGGSCRSWPSGGATP